MRWQMSENPTKVAAMEVELKEKPAHTPLPNSPLKATPALDLPTPIPAAISPVTGDQEAETEILEKKLTVYDLRKMDKLRNTPWKSAAAKKAALATKTPYSGEGKTGILLAQVGTVAPVACTRCVVDADGHSKGIFDSCYHEPGYYGGVCAHCKYHHHGNKCSIRQYNAPYRVYV